MDNNELIVDNLSKEITELVIKAREKLKDEMNNEQIKCYWDIGRKIIEEEQKGKSKKTVVAAAFSHAVAGAGILGGG